MRKEKQFPSPPSVRAATGKAAPGLFQAEPSPTEGRHPWSFSRYPIPCSSRCWLSVLQQGGSFCSVGNKRGRVFLGDENPTQTPQNLKLHKLSPGHDRTPSPPGTRISGDIPGHVPGRLQQPPCPALSLNFMSVLCALRDEDPRLWSPGSIPAAEVN